MHIYMHTYNNTTGALCIYTCIHITICIYMYAHDKIHMHITICIRQRWGSNCILPASQKLCSVAHARESGARRCARQTKPDELLAAHEQDFVWCGRVASTAEVRDKTNITHSRTCVSHTLASRLCARDSVTNELIKSFHIYLFLTYEWVTTREWIIWMSYYTWMFWVCASWSSWSHELMFQTLFPSRTHELLGMHKSCLMSHDSFVCRNVWETSSWQELCVRHEFVRWNVGETWVPMSYI